MRPTPRPLPARRARRALAIALAVGGLAVGGRASGDDSPADRRREEIEHAFAEQRFDDVEALAQEAGEAEPLLVLRRFWRRAEAPPEATPLPTTALGRRRADWLERRRPPDDPTPYPRAAPEETDRFPRITALVLDRLKRERDGARGLPDASPLASAHGDPFREFLAAIAAPAFLGDAAAPAAPTDEHARRVDAVAARNRLLGLVGLGALLSTGIAAFVLLRRRPAPAKS
jgi:hypothetical protein